MFGDDPTVAHEGVTTPAEVILVIVFEELIGT